MHLWSMLLSGLLFAHWQKEIILGANSKHTSIYNGITLFDGKTYVIKLLTQNQVGMQTSLFASSTNKRNKKNHIKAEAV